MPEKTTMVGAAQRQNPKDTVWRQIAHGIDRRRPFDYNAFVVSLLCHSPTPRARAGSLPENGGRRLNDCPNVARYDPQSADASKKTRQDK